MKVFHAVLLTVAVSFLISGIVSAQNNEPGTPGYDIEKDSRAATRAKAYDQKGIFCGYWDDSEETGDGFYGYMIKMGNDVFSFTIDLPSNEEAEALAKQPPGTPIIFDFKVHKTVDPTVGELDLAVSLTKVQVAPGEVNSAGCPNISD
jgi:hypothetical protein